jgi:hypothetical protein
MFTVHMLIHQYKLQFEFITMGLIVPPRLCPSDTESTWIFTGSTYKARNSWITDPLPVDRYNSEVTTRNISSDLNNTIYEGCHVTPLAVIAQSVRVTDWTIGVLGFDSRRGGWEFFSSPPRPERFWCPPSLLSNGYQGLLPWGWRDRGVKLTTHLHLVPRSKNEWSYTSTPQIRLHGVVLG